MSYELYKTLHVLAVVFVFFSLGGLTFHGLNGGDKETALKRRWVAITHGVGGVFILVGGFGLMARMGIQQGAVWPLWLYIKLAMWLLVGASIVLLLRFPRLARLWWFVVPLIGGVAIASAVYKPHGGSGAPAAHAAEATPAALNRP